MTRAAQHGFTLVEMIVAIVITGVVVAMVGMFISVPIQSYVDVANRAELTDTADGALRRISRDLRRALPNSIRTSPSSACVEFLPTSTGGRYRADVAGNVLDFNNATTTFDVLGDMPSIPASGDRVVVYNLGIGTADAYSGGNMATVADATANSITLTAPKLFPFESPGNRFQVIPNSEQAVFYVCSNAGTDTSGNGTGTLYRFSGYGINAAAPAGCPTPVVDTPILADHVSACTFTYTGGVTERSGLVSMQLSLTKGSETVSLYHEVHVSNVP